LEFNVPFQHKYGYIRDENLHGRRVWSLARTSLKVVVKGQGDQC